MASYANLPEEDRWALTQFILHWVPEEVEIESTEEAIVSACRALSAPEQPPAIPITAAMHALIQDQVEERAIELAQYGTVKLQPGADPKLGKQVYEANCVACHGVAGSGRSIGPYGAQPPYLYISTDRLSPATAGGTTAEFAERSYAGAHATLGYMGSAAMLSKTEWANLQAYVATLEGTAEITVQPPAAPAQAPNQGAEAADPTVAPDAPPQDPAATERLEEPAAPTTPAPGE
jgi:mono/diheme cytochrome c family protein